MHGGAATVEAGFVPTGGPALGGAAFGGTFFNLEVGAGTLTAGGAGVRDMQFGHGPTGGGFKKLYHGEIDINDASRAIKNEEAAEAKKNKINFNKLMNGRLWPRWLLQAWAQA
jgi:hypothetical protein